jgi:hypothetical protein
VFYRATPYKNALFSLGIKRILKIVLNKSKIGVDGISNLPIMRASLQGTGRQKGGLNSVAAARKSIHWVFPDENDLQ